MIHLLTTILSTRARCGVYVPTNAHPSIMPHRGEGDVDRALYCPTCFEVFRLDDYFRQALRPVGPSVDGYPFDTAV